MRLLPLASDARFATVFVVVAVGILAVFLLAWWFGREQRLKRLLRSLPVRSIGQLHPDETARVVGRARASGETLTAPVSERPCLCYVVVVREKRGKHWRTVLQESRGLPFLLEDGSGRILVDPTQAELVLDYDGSSRSGTFDDATPAEEALLERHGLASRGWVFNKALQYREAIIGVGEHVAALGTCRRGSDGGPLRLVGTADGRVVLCDSPSTTSA